MRGLTKVKQIIKRIPHGQKRRISGKYSGGSPIVGRALLMYITSPFFIDEQSEGYRSHINIRNTLTIVKVLNDLNYEVDIVDYNDDEFETSSVYDLIIGIGPAFDYNKKYYNSSKIKIYYATGMHWFTESFLIYKRYFDLKLRKGVVLIPQRLNRPYFSAEKSDEIISVQNHFTNETYAHLGKPIHFVPLTGSFDSQPPMSNIKMKNTKTLLWLSGSGMILKGLDLVLDAISHCPDIKLKICANITNEPEFEKIFEQELYKRANIDYVGFMDIGSEKFKDIVSDCVGIIFPYPEGEISGSIINGMYFGLIPIISYCSNETIQEFSWKITCDINNIIIRLQEFSSLTDDEIERRSRMTIEYVSKYHSPKAEYDEWKKTLSSILTKYNDS